MDKKTSINKDKSNKLNSDIDFNSSEVKPILAIETSGSLCAASIYFNDEIFFQTIIKEKNIHSKKIIDVINSTLSESKAKLNELKWIAISAGPGSFTGLRIGFSAAKAISFAHSIPIILVPTFEALALQIISEIPNIQEFIIANKVNNDEIYYAKFQNKKNIYNFVEPLKIISKNDFENKKNSIKIFGNSKNNTEQNNYAEPVPFYVAKWSEMFGKEKIICDIDYIEPLYIKNFLIQGE